MIESKKELLQGFFREWGSPSDIGTIRIQHSFIRAEILKEASRIKYYDESAASTINELEKAVEILKTYREALQEQYSYLSTAAFLPVVKLRREKQWKGPVTYYLEHYRKLIDTGEEIRESYTEFSGTERHKAIKAFNDYVKQHPGISAEIEIEKGKWEK